jgi:hypothetical protein
MTTTKDKTMTVQLKFVQIILINIAPEYQRLTDMARVKRMAANFHEGAAKAVSLSQRSDGTLWIYDGLHTLELYSMKGFDLIPAKIVKGDSKKEACLFDLMNGPGAIKASPAQRQVAQVHYELPIALEAQALMDEYGIVIAAGGAKKGTTRAVNAIKTYLKSDRPRLIQAMDMIDRLWSEQDNAWTHLIVRGAWEVAGAGLIDVTAAGLLAKKITPRRVLDVASGMQSATGTLGGGAAYVKKAMLQLAKVSA